MRNRLRHLRDSERGISLVFVSTSFMAFMTATTLAIDVGMLMTARSQAQNSADAGAHAGAVALVFNSFTDRQPTGPVVQSAINGALSNQVMGGAVSVSSADVTFPLDPDGNATRVAVTVRRTAATDNAVPTLLGQIFSLDAFDIVATAKAV